jgi:hypothetical protein
MADSRPAAYEAAPVAPSAVAVERARPHTTLIGLLALGHFVIDVTQGSLPAVLPFVKQMHALSYAQVAMIVPRNAGMASGLILGFAIGLGGAGVTVLGWVADRWGVPTALWISALTPLVAFVLTRLLPAPHDAPA